MIIHLVSGLDAPADANGLVDLQKKLQLAIPNSIETLHKWDEFKLTSPCDVLIGHSYGFSRIMSELKRTGFSVKLLIGLDGVPRWADWGFFSQFWEWEIPTGQTGVAVSYTKNGLYGLTIPMSSKFVNPGPKVFNKYVGAFHNDLPKVPWVHSEIVGFVKDLAQK